MTETIPYEPGLTAEKENVATTMEEQEPKGPLRARATMPLSPSSSSVSSWLKQASSTSSSSSSSSSETEDEQDIKSEISSISNDSFHRFFSTAAARQRQQQQQQQRDYQRRLLLPYVAGEVPGAVVTAPIPREICIPTPLEVPIHNVNAAASLPPVESIYNNEEEPRASLRPRHCRKLSLDCYTDEAAYPHPPQDDGEEVPTSSGSDNSTQESSSADDDEQSIDTDSSNESEEENCGAAVGSESTPLVQAVDEAEVAYHCADVTKTPTSFVATTCSATATATDAAPSPTTRNSSTPVPLVRSSSVISCRSGASTGAGSTVFYYPCFHEDQKLLGNRPRRRPIVRENVSIGGVVGQSWRILQTESTVLSATDATIMSPAATIVSVTAPAIVAEQPRPLSPISSVGGGGGAAGFMTSSERTYPSASILLESTTQQQQQHNQASPSTPAYRRRRQQRAIQHVVKSELQYMWNRVKDSSFRRGKRKQNSRRSKRQRPQFERSAKGFLT